MTKYIFTFFLLSSLTLSAQTRLRVMEWNVENLFDCRHDTLKDDHEFLPDSERRWTHGRYWRKINDMAKTIMAVGEARLPDIVGLCEVENDSVMHRLTRTSALKTLGYDYIITASDDSRGIDCALLYQPMRFGLVQWRAVRVPSVKHGFAPTRDILYAKGVVGRNDTLHVLVCHLPSQRGGREAKLHRALAVKTLQHIVDSLRGRNMLVMGDFNTHRPQIGSLRRLPLITTHGDSVRGTYRYQGDWSQLDHIFVSPSVKADTLHVANYPFLLEPNLTHGGLQPRRTYRGPVYHGGVSDHLPVWADVCM